MSLRVRLLFNFPTYKVLAISIVSVIVGIASIALSAVGLVNQIWGHFVASGIWSGGLIILCGLFGITASQTRGVCVVKTFMVLAVSSCIASLAAIALSCGGVIFESRFYPETAPRHPNTKMIHGMLIGTGTLQLILSLVCAIICIKHVCCPPKPKRQSLPVQPEASGDLRRGNQLRESQSSSAPLLAKHRRTNEAAAASGPPCEQESANENEPSGSKSHQSRDKHKANKKRQKRNSSDKSSTENRQSSRSPRRRSKEGRRLSNERGNRRNSGEGEDRPQQSSQRNKSPDRYANKPNTVVAPSEESLIIDNSGGLGMAIHLGGPQDNSHGEESVEHLILQNNMDDLPPYEEAVMETGENFAASGFFSDDIVLRQPSQNSQDSIDRLAQDIDNTQLKEIDAEQEALLCLSAAIQSPTSPNSGVSNLLSGCNFSSLSDDSVLDNAHKLSTDLIIHSQENSDAEHEDKNFVPCISHDEKQNLLQKYCGAKPDPQGVIYKGFSRETDVIRESVDARPKRSKSFQHHKERDFARGKSVSSRQLSYDENDDGDKRPDGSFRHTSKSFSRTPSVPSKPPPKPPRTSSLRQNGNKERPKSATLPYSHFAAMKILEGQEKGGDAEQNSPVRNASDQVEPLLDKSSNSSVHQIQPPRFRYPRAKLTKNTFEEPFSENGKGKVSTNDSQNIYPEPQSVSDGSVRPKIDRNLFRLPITQTQDSTTETNEVRSPLKSPTDYSAIPLKDILMKGQGTSSAAKRQSDIEPSSCSSEEESPTEPTSDDRADDTAQDGDRDSLNMYDNEGRPMYSFLL